MSAEITVGMTLGPLEKPAITTRQLVEYAGASGDFNRIHYDEPFAKAGGFPSVIAHGMLSMAFFGQLLTDRFGVAAVERLSTRFKAVTFPGDVITVSGEVTEVAKTHTVIKLIAKNAAGVVTLEGSAIIKGGLR